MRHLLILLTLASTAAAAQTKDNPYYTRHIASKNDILYTYNIGLDYHGAFDKVLEDATGFCATKYGMGTVERVPAQCFTREAKDGSSKTGCTVAFKCQ